MTDANDHDPYCAVQLSAVGTDGGGGRYVFQANAGQREALAARFGCLEISNFEVEAKVMPARKDGYFRVNGIVTARVVQNCVVTLEPVVSTFEQPLDLLLVPGDAVVGAETEMAEDDFETYSGNEVDLGEIGAVELALAIDPYPRAPGVSVSDLGPGGDDKGYEVHEEGYVSRNRPFEALAALKRKE